MDKSAFGKRNSVGLDHSLWGKSQNQRQTSNSVLFCPPNSQSKRGKLDTSTCWKCSRQIFSKIDSPKNIEKSRHFIFSLGDLVSPMKQSQWKVEIVLCVQNIRSKIKRILFANAHHSKTIKHRFESMELACIALTVKASAIFSALIFCRPICRQLVWFWSMKSETFDKRFWEVWLGRTNETVANATVLFWKITVGCVTCHSNSIVR